ncbi:hypothetical protein [Burkholderia gladioli]|uniref:hypothetical protein n=1 Tax=Burkholderia gladioli TaxID=28095 RepID=UPI001640D16C|nr:hypothetical protein [Burkholderia gladioli]
MPKIDARQAPWKDFDGNPIYEGSVIEHPSGECGTIVFLEGQEDANDSWRVNYGDGHLVRLCLQIGDKGQARVTG